MKKLQSGREKEKEIVSIETILNNADNAQISEQINPALPIYFFMEKNRRELKRRLRKEEIAEREKERDEKEEKEG